MAEIKLQKRYKYAGDIFQGLVENAGFQPEVAAALLNDIPDADVVPRAEFDRVVRELERVEALYFAKDTQLEDAKAEEAREIFDELEEILCGEFLTERFWFDLGKLRIKHMEVQK